MNQYDKIYGGLVGIAYGDAFGMPSEMWTRNEIRKYFGKIDDFLPGPPENMISNQLVRGEVTDDTINTILVIEMLGESNGKVNPELFIKKLRTWSATCEKSIAVTGPSTAKAFALLDVGTPMKEAGKTGITNGASMKILPIGLLAKPQNLEEMVEQVHKICLPTHNTSVSVSGASAIAAAASYAVSGGKDLDEMLALSCKAAILGSKRGKEVCSPSVEKRIRLAWDLAGKDIRMGKTEEEVLNDIYELVGTGLPIVESVPAALALVYLAKGNPGICARYCANIGGDTDTIGAMACGICGILAGSKGFLQEEIQLLESVNGISFERLSGVLYSLI